MGYYFFLIALEVDAVCLFDGSVELEVGMGKIGEENVEVFAVQLGETAIRMIVSALQDILCAILDLLSLLVGWVRC